MTDKNQPNYSQSVVTIRPAEEVDTAMPIKPLGVNTITIGQAVETDTANPITPLVEQAVEIESRIPPDAKQAVTDFIKEQISQFDEAVAEFIINFPDDLVPFRDAILDLIRLLTGWG